MNAKELMDKYHESYEYMAQSGKPENMKMFGSIMTQMMEDMAQTSPAKAEEFINRLEAVKWKNYLTPAEADKIVANMDPKAPWTRDQWRAAMEQNGYEMEEWPYYNRCALYTAMNMIMSDSSVTLTKYVGSENLFNAVHDLAVDKLKDKDGVFHIRKYFDR